MVLSAKDYGVPQNRPRIFIVLWREDVNITNFVYPSPMKTKLEWEIFWKQMFQNHLRFQINYGKVIREEKVNMSKKEMDLDIACLMKNQNLQAQFPVGITRMEVKF